jgi:hypothetical protein
MMEHLANRRRPIRSRDMRWIFAAGMAGATIVMLGLEVLARLV